MENNEVVVKGKPWDYLGHDVDDSKSIAENLDDLGLNYRVASRLIYYPDMNDKMSRVPKVEAIIREDNGEFIAEAKEGATIIQNKDAFGILEPLQREYGATIEKMGVDTHLQGPFVVCKMPPINVLDEPISPYVVVRNMHNGSSKPLRVFSTPIRVWCQNQLSALENAKNSVVFKTSTAYDSYDRNKEIAGYVIEGLEKRQTRMKLEASKFASIKVSDYEFANIANELYPTDEEAGIRKDSIAKNTYYKEHLLEAYNADDLNNVRGTAYGVINAVADFSQHTLPYKAATKGEGADYDDMFEKAMFTINTVQYIRYLMMNRYGVKFN